MVFCASLVDFLFSNLVGPILFYAPKYVSIPVFNRWLSRILARILVILKIPEMTGISRLFWNSVFLLVTGDQNHHPEKTTKACIISLDIVVAKAPIIINKSNQE
jgi:NAD dependent epimerase/dehydratase family enzyme